MRTNRKVASRDLESGLGPKNAFIWSKEKLLIVFERMRFEEVVADALAIVVISVELAGKVPLSCREPEHH